MQLYRFIYRYRYRYKYRYIYDPILLYINVILFCNIAIIFIVFASKNARRAVLTTRVTQTFTLRVISQWFITVIKPRRQKYIMYTCPFFN